MNTTIITVAVVGSGISAHPALSGKVIANVSKVGYLKWGDLNVIGRTNPLARTRPNEILWGDSQQTADE